jgi:phosphoribosyl-ATP pyrophosphohydrolase
MSNMSYCRFQNTLADFKECAEVIDETGLSKDENRARIKLIEEAAEMLMSLGVDVRKADVDEAIDNIGND